MRVPAITEVKNHLEGMQKKGLINAWELPYENLLTRLSAAIFFVDVANSGQSELTVWKELEKYDHFSYRLNTEKKLSQMRYRITFSLEEKEKNSKGEMVGEAPVPTHV